MDKTTYWLDNGWSTARVTTKIQSKLSSPTPHLVFFHGHVAPLSVTMDTLGHPPHPLPRPDPLDEVSGEEPHLVSALALEYTHSSH